MSSHNLVGLPTSSAKRYKARDVQDGDIMYRYRSAWINYPLEALFSLFTAGAGAAVDTSSAQTLTNKRITTRVQAAADATSITPLGDSADLVTQANTQAAGTLTVNAPTGTPTNGQRLTMRIKSTNVQTYSWNASYRGSTAAALPTASSGSALTDYIGFIYNAADSKWDYVSSVAGF